MKIHFACTITALLLCLSLCGCTLFSPSQCTTSQSSSAVSGSLAHKETNDIARALALLSGVKPKRNISADFLRWGCENVDAAFAAKLADAIEQSGYSDALFFELFGSTLLVLYDLFTAAPETQPNLHMASNTVTPAVLAFTGDVNLSDTWETMQYLSTQQKGIRDCITAPLLSKMQAADVLLINNEFCFSNQGTAMPGKQYTFRSKTENAQILKYMGVDIVSLANNHVFDFGEAAFLDTLDTLTDAGIPYVGAGRDRAEASLPQYFLVGGMKVAYVAASRAEKHILTPEAGENTPGVLRAYDPALFLAAVAAARENADVVIAYPHWGTENTTVLEDAQITLGQQLIDAGADIVVGAHPHNLQGIDFYNGKPVVYSLGNFWFNTNTVDTALLEVKLNNPDNLSVRIIPCLQKGGVTSILEDTTSRQRIFDLLTSISPSPVSITEDGLVTAGVDTA